MKLRRVWERIFTTVMRKSPTHLRRLQLDAHIKIVIQYPFRWFQIHDVHSTTPGYCSSILADHRTLYPSLNQKCRFWSDSDSDSSPAPLSCRPSSRSVCFETCWVTLTDMVSRPIASRRLSTPRIRTTFELGVSWVLYPFWLVVPRLTRTDISVNDIPWNRKLHWTCCESWRELLTIIGLICTR